LQARAGLGLNFIYGGTAVVAGLMCVLSFSITRTARPSFDPSTINPINPGVKL